MNFKRIGLVFLFVFILPTLSQAKKMSFKLYLSVEADSADRDPFVSELRKDLRQSGDVEFVSSANNATYVVTIVLSKLENKNGYVTGCAAAVAVNALCTSPGLSLLSGSDDVTDMAHRVAASINESYLEPVREAVVK